ncbi:hypothetical protein J2S19_002301 [Metabacillus malikii]|uniref:EcsC family protein n=2 Tax=Metabacillus malikii TaxID=1504265 RepID=A0ABT9ZFJ1_9BACI|nr:hypothetical protein [Metabacillus malikii]
MHEQQLLTEMMNWEDDLKQDNRTDIQLTVTKWINHGMSQIPLHAKQTFYKTFDTLIFHLHSFIQNSAVQEDTRKQIIITAKAINEEINDISDLHQLPLSQLIFLAENQTSKQRLYSFVQGGVTGIGGILMSSIDIPAQTVINLRTVQSVAMCYGYELKTPYEMMISLKVFHAALLPKHLQYEQWCKLKEEIRDRDTMNYFYEGKEKLTFTTDAEFLLKQIAKLSAISLFKRKLLSGLPVISIMIGASMNYQLTRQVSEFANKFYTYRKLVEDN